MSAIQLSARSEGNDKERRPPACRARGPIGAGKPVRMNYVDGYSGLCYGYLGVGPEGIPRPRVARNVGRTSALTAESAYPRRVLPIGALPNLACGLHGDHAALARAGAILAGPAFTATGFLKVRWTRPAGPPQEAGSTLRNFSTGALAAPVLPLVIDVSSPPLAIDPRRAEQRPDAGPCRNLRDRHLSPRQVVR
jgi:hypothetical protein